MAVSPDHPPSDEHKKESSRRWGELAVSRRQFFYTAILGGSALGLGVLSRPEVNEALESKLERKSVLDRLQDESLSNRRSALMTAVETVVMWAGSMFLGDVLDRAKIAHGGHAGDGPLYEEQMAKHPLRTYIRDNFAVPIVEEALFRMLPSAFFSEDLVPKMNVRWDVGLTSAIMFGLIHNFSKPEPEKITIHFNSFPLEQILIGIYCWYAQRKGGFFHAAGAHVLYNNLCSLYPGLLCSKAAPPGI